MPLEIFDYRTDIRNLLVTPHIRSRFLRMEPGQVANRHSHALGHEIFLILQGRAHFEVDGEEAELGPGQLCVARVDEPHQVRVVGDEPMVMYLSVTPHVQPTHTSRTERGERLPTRFAPSSAYDVETDTEPPVAELVARFVEASAQLAESGAEAAASHSSQWMTPSRSGQRQPITVPTPASPAAASPASIVSGPTSSATAPLSFKI